MSHSADLEVVHRLRNADGHLRAVIAMIEAGKPCEAVLYQLRAVEGALRAAGSRMLREQWERDRTSLLTCDCEQEQMETIERLVRLYQLSSKMSEKQYRYKEFENE